MVSSLLLFNLCRFLNLIGTIGFSSGSYVFISGFSTGIDGIFIGYSCLNEALGTYSYLYDALGTYGSYSFVYYFFVSTEGTYESSFFPSLFLKLNLFGLNIACYSSLGGSCWGIYTAIFLGYIFY